MKKVNEVGNPKSETEYSENPVKKKKPISIAQLKRRGTILQSIGKIKDSDYLSKRTAPTKRTNSKRSLDPGESQKKFKTI